MDVIALWVIVRGEQRRGKEVGGLGGGNWGHWSRPPSSATGKQPWTDPFSEDQLRSRAQVRFSLPNFYPLQNRKNLLFISSSRLKISFMVEMVLLKERRVIFL
jgi:hypothetical protein